MTVRARKAVASVDIVLYRFHRRDEFCIRAVLVAINAGVGGSALTRKGNVALNENSDCNQEQQPHGMLIVPSSGGGDYWLSHDSVAMHGNPSPS